MLALLTLSLSMRLVLQRCKSASVTVGGSVVSNIGGGIVALCGLHVEDTDADLQYCAKKLLGAKLWPNENEKLWRQSVKQQDLEVLLVSQFTLYGSVANKKHSPDYKDAMKSEQASANFDAFASLCAAEYDVSRVKTGVFGEMMDVALVNDGPVTLVVDSREDLAR